MKFLRSIVECEASATAIEYGLLIALIGLALLGALTGLADNTANIWDGVANEFDSASN